MFFQGHRGDPGWLQKIKQPGAEAEDLGLRADPRSLVAPPKGGPAEKLVYQLT